MSIRIVYFYYSGDRTCLFFSITSWHRVPNSEIYTLKIILFFNLVFIFCLSRTICKTIAASTWRVKCNRYYGDIICHSLGIK